MTRAYTRFIPGDEIGAVTEWDFPVVGHASARFAAKLKAQATSDERQREDALRHLGYSEGYAKGVAQGQATATLEGQRQLSEYISGQARDLSARFATIFEASHAQLEAAEQTLAQGVLELACEIARQVVRRELSVSSNGLLPVVREALGMLTADNKAAVVRLHPRDLEHIDDVLRQEFPDLGLTLVGDATLLSGGCIVEAAGTVIDGTVEKRWARAVAGLGLDSAWEEVIDVKH